MFPDPAADQEMSDSIKKIRAKLIEMVQERELRSFYDQMEKMRKERRYKILCLNPSDLVNAMRKNLKSSTTITIPIIDLPEDVTVLNTYTEPCGLAVCFVLSHPLWPKVPFNEEPPKIILEYFSTPMNKLPNQSNCDQPIYNQPNSNQLES